MKVIFDVRKKGTKHHQRFIDYAFKKFVNCSNAQVFLREKMGLNCVAVNGQAERQG